MFIQKPFSLTSGAAGEAAYVPGGAIVVNGTDEYLDHTPTGAGNRQKYSFSCWTKITNNNTSNGYLIDAGPIAGNGEGIRYTGSTDTPLLITGAGGVGYSNRVTSAIYRDTTAWNHVFYIKDTTNGNPSSRLRLFVNGEEVTDFSATQNPPLNDALGNMNNTNTHRLGGNAGQATPSQLYSGYYSEVILLDGYVALPSDFGQYDSNNVWVPIDPTTVVTAGKGTNGFWLDFADSSDLGNDVSYSGLSVGTDNSFTSVNMGTANSVLDRPADTAPTIGNYCTWNPAARSSANSTTTFATLSNGNLTTTASGTVYNFEMPTFQVDSGKWYFEVELDNDAGANWVGVAQTFLKVPSNGDDAGIGDLNGYAYRDSNGNKVNASGTSSSYGATYTTGNVIGVALDLDNGAIWFSKDDTWQASATKAEIEAGTTTNAAFTGLTGAFGPMVQMSSSGAVFILNTGQTSFAGTKPTGFKTLNTANLSEPTVKNGENNFLPMIYEGNGAGQRVGNFIPFTDSHTVDNSCVLDEGDTDYFTRSVWGTSTDTTKWTLSMWVKRGALGKQRLVDGGSNLSNQTLIEFTATGALDFQLYVAPNSGRITSNRLFKQTDTWTHIVIVHDSSNGTANDKMRMYINGSRTTSLGANTPPSSNLSLLTINGQNTNIGYDLINTSNPFDGYMSEVIFVDGYALDASPFGETDTSTNRWIPKAVTAATLNTAGGGSSGFGTNGFYLEFETDSALGTDTSGNTNTFTPTNIAAANQTVDTPTKNIATLSPSLTNGNGVVSAGNLHFTIGTTNNAVGGSPIGVSSGKFYGEATYTSGSAYGFGFGFANSTSTVIQSGSGTYLGEVTDSWGINASNGNVTNGGSVVVSSYAGGALSNGTTYMWCLDMDNGKWWAGNADTNTWFTNGSVGNPATGANAGITGLTGTIHICASAYNGDAITMNFGQTTFVNAANIPTEFNSLNQDNLAANTAGITGFSWIKNRDAADNNILQDRVRGIYDYIISNDTDVEDANANSVQRFLQQGVQIGNMDAVNTSAESYVLWQWAANGTGTLNELGSIDSYVSANTDAGFSIVKYTGTGSAATVGHGLSSAPSFIINKPLASATDNNLQVYHSEMGATKAMWLNDIFDPVTSSTYWNDTAPSTTAPFVFSIGTDRDSAVEYINYCWAEVEGYSKFGSYTGNTSTDGPYIYTGFSPSYVMIKRLDADDEWVIVDSARSPYNPTKHYLAANYPDAERTTGTQVELDWASNGFKVVVSHARCNVGTYIYAAFAAHPFGGSGVGQARAR